MGTHYGREQEWEGDWVPLQKQPLGPLGRRGWTPKFHSVPVTPGPSGDCPSLDSSFLTIFHLPMPFSSLLAFLQACYFFLFSFLSSLKRL